MSVATIYVSRALHVNRFLREYEYYTKQGPDGRPRSSLPRAPRSLRGFLRAVLRW